MAGSIAGLVKQIPGFGRIATSHALRRWARELRLFGVVRQANIFSAERDAVVDLIEESGFRQWAKFWHYGRTQISLTTRLFIEQIYSDLGEPWSQLITGFGPIKKIQGIGMLASESRRRAAPLLGGSKRIPQSATRLRNIRRQRAAKVKRQHFHGR